MLSNVKIQADARLTTRSCPFTSYKPRLRIIEMQHGRRVNSVNERAPIEEADTLVPSVQDHVCREGDGSAWECVAASTRDSLN